MSPVLGQVEQDFRVSDSPCLGDQMFHFGEHQPEDQTQILLRRLNGIEARLDALEAAQWPARLHRALLTLRRWGRQLQARLRALWP